jgi:hypothetical protein
MIESNVVSMHENKLLSAALAYASIGWHVLPCWWAIGDKCACGNAECKSPAKHPIAKLAPWGQNSATVDAEKIKQWWAQYPQANIAAYLEPSKLVAIDIDPRNGGLQSIEDIEAKHGALQSDLMQFTGGGGEHRVFERPSNTQMPGKLGNGVDVKANGYIMLEPSNHVSGGSYAWEASSDPRDGVMASPLPDWLRDLAAPKPVGSPDEPVSGRVMPIGDDTKSELIEALEAIPSDDRDVWLKVGMALQSIGDPNWAFQAWDWWSQKSAKYNRVDQLRVWRSFKAKGLDGVTYKTIFGIAKEYGAVVMPISSGSSSEPPVPIESVNIMVERPQMEVDPQLLTPPGVLRDIVDWINATSPKPQPQFAVQTAIAFCSTVLGRRFSTDHGNWPALYLLNIGLSASGKEYAKTALERLLEACSLQNLIGPASYSSDSGLLSTLHGKPNHVTVIDEFHRVLEQAAVKGNARAQGMLRALIELWGRSDGTMRSVGYSTVGMNARETAALQDRDVANPSLTLLSMAIPSFWETIGSAAAKDGFLNRFLIVETSIGRQVGQFSAKVPVPQSVIDWATQVRAMYTGVIDPDTNPVGIAPNIIPISQPAMRLFNAFSQECIDLMDAHDKDGLAEMFGRSNEIAMKLALVLAMSRGASQVADSDAQWSILYSKTYAMRTVHRLQTCMADSLFEAAKNQALSWLIKQGRAMNVARIVDGCRKLKAMDKRQQINVMDSLVYLGKVQCVEKPGGHSGRGVKTPWYVAIEEEAGV